MKDSNEVIIDSSENRALFLIIKLISFAAFPLFHCLLVRPHKGLHLSLVVNQRIL